MLAPDAQSISIPHPTKAGHAFEGYLVTPVRATEQSPAPGMLILHEAFGLNDNIRAITRRFAAEGYVALALDLFSDGAKMICMFRAFYGLLAAPLNNGTVKNVRAVFEYLRKVKCV